MVHTITYHNRIISPMEELAASTLLPPSPTAHYTEVDMSQLGAATAEFDRIRGGGCGGSDSDEEEGGSEDDDDYSNLHDSISQLMVDSELGDGTIERPHLSVQFESESVKALYADRGASSAYRADVGWDLHCVADVDVLPGLGHTIDFQLRACCTTGDTPTPLLLLPRSSIVKTPLRLSNSIGLIDPGYRGTIRAVVDNLSSEPYTIRRGDRLMQLLSLPTLGMTWTAVAALSATDRGEAGFGSTGI